MAVSIQRYLSMTCTQGGADTFVQASVNTEIVPADGYAFKVTGIDFAITSPLNGIAADCRLQWSLSRDTKTAICPYNDSDSILYDQFNVSFTTSGIIYIPGSSRYRNLDGIYLVEPTIYAQLASASTGLTNVADWRIYYEEVKLSEVEILRILNNA